MPHVSSVATMTERAKMRAGLPYDSRDPELLALYRRLRPLLRRYNDEGMEMDGPARTALLRQMLGAVGEGVWVEPPLLCDYGVHVTVGDGTFVHYGAVWLDSAEIRIGSGVLIGPRVTLGTATHPVRAADRVVRDDGQPPRYVTRALPITVEDDVWIGAGATVLPGVCLGVGAVVGAGAVVTKDVPPGAVVVGVPGRIVGTTAGDPTGAAPQPV